jgi:hypothetical protein
VDAGHDYQLSASTNFDQMRRAVRCQQVALDPTERLVCAQQPDGQFLGRLNVGDQKVFVTLPNELINLF